jgi:hypothetical protein
MRRVFLPLISRFASHKEKEIISNYNKAVEKIKRTK